MGGAGRRHGDSGRSKGGIQWIWRFPRFGLGSGLGLQWIMGWTDLYSWEKGKKAKVWILRLSLESQRSPIWDLDPDGREREREQINERSRPGSCGDVARKRGTRGTDNFSRDIRRFARKWKESEDGLSYDVT